MTNPTSVNPTQNSPNLVNPTQNSPNLVNPIQNSPDWSLYKHKIMYHHFYCCYNHPIYTPRSSFDF